MIIEHDNQGRITHVVADPTPPGLAEHYTSLGLQFVEIQPTPEYSQDIDPDTGEPMFDEQGEPIMAVSSLVSAKCDIERDYILDGAITKRPVLDLPDTVTIVADGVDEAIFDGLPVPCSVSVDDEPMEVADGSLVVASDMPTEYTITFNQWPYMPHTAKVIANASDA